MKLKLKLMASTVMATTLLLSGNAHALDMQALLANAFKGPSNASLSTSPALGTAITAAQQSGQAQNVASQAATVRNNAAIVTANAAAVAQGAPAPFVAPAVTTPVVGSTSSILDNFIAAQPALLTKIKAAIPNFVVVPVKPVSKS